VGSIGKLDALETLIRELISVSQSKVQPVTGYPSHPIPSSSVLAFVQDGDCNLALCKESQEFIQANTWSLWIDRVTVLIQAALSKVRCYCVFLLLLFSFFSAPTFI
jgi:hypothetical protein